MPGSRSNSKSVLQSERLIAGLLFVCMLLIFWFAPVRVMTDSNYSMLLSQSLWQHGSFALDQYSLPHLPPWVTEDHTVNGNIYQLELVGQHIYYFFPPGSSVLSVPYVALMNAVGVSASNPDGTYSPRGELRLQAGLAALLMAALAVVFYYTSRLLLPLGWSVVVAVGGALGTQVWSTASRVLWTDTWAIFLLGLVVWILLAHEAGKHRMNPVLLATLLAWMYFVRPTNAVPILAVTVYLFISHRKLFLPYMLTGALWCAGFMAYSWHHFGQLRPNYYRTSRLKFDQFWTAVAGNLISPSRGLLVYVPVLLFVAYLLVRYRNRVAFRGLLVLSLVVGVGHLVISSGFYPWHGGGCFGPRYMTGLVPWFVLLAILALRAMLDEHEIQNAKASSLKRRTEIAAGAALLILSIFINGRGAISYETWKWNGVPVSVDDRPERVWDWRYPQFLAGLIHPPLDHEPPLLEAETQIDFANSRDDAFLWYGWSRPETEYRWSDGDEAALIFALNQAEDVELQMNLLPFLAGGKLKEQRLDLKLNGQHLQTLSLREESDNIYSIKLPKHLLRQKNVLIFKLPDANSPEALNVGFDQRLLGIRVRWMKLKPETAGKI